jgi:hypothetical protein
MQTNADKTTPNMTDSATIGNDSWFDETLVDAPETTRRAD